MNGGLAVGVGIVLAGSSLAGTCTWKEAGDASRVNDWNWCEAGNFTRNVAPSSGDTVIIPGGTRVWLRADDAESRARVNSLAFVNTFGSGDNLSELVVEVAENETFTLNPPVHYANPDSGSGPDGTQGRLVKTGQGTLILGSNDTTQDYQLKLEIVEGALKMNPKGASNSNYFFGDIAVSNGAALFTVPNGAYTRCGRVFGTGTITNDGVAAVFRPTVGWASNPCVIDAFLSSAISFWPACYARVTCPSNCNTFCYVWNNNGALLSEAGVLETPSFGHILQPSYIGCLNYMQTSSGGGFFRYIGDHDEIVDTKLSVGYPCEGPSGIDAGPHGGLTFTGYWEVTSSSSRGNCNFYLTGSNAVPCRIASSQIAPNNDVSTFSFTKSGSGTWRFTDEGVRYNRGGFWVDEGTLQFESIAEAGSACSLGLSTLLFPRGYYGTVEDAPRVGYAFSLGAPGTVGTLEYVGTNTVRQLTRSAALAGDGRVVNAAAANGAEARRYFAWFAGVSSITNRLNRLILDGEGASGGDEIANVCDGEAGRVGIVKRGAGTWRLSGTNTFSGPVVVERGKLVLVTPHYTWFRVTMKGIKALDYPDYAGKKETSLHELAFFDKDGYRQNIGLKRVEDQYPKSYSGNPATYFRDVILPGECTYAETPFFNTAVNGWYYGRDTSDIDHLFDNDTTKIWVFQRYLPGSQGGTGMNNFPLPILFRLPEGAKPVTSYDIVTHRNSIGDLASYVMHPKCWTVEGSVDGRTWVLLHTMEDSGATGQTLSIHGAGKWMSKDETFSPAHGVTVPHTGGQAIAVAPGGAIGDSFQNVEYVSVAAGAKLVVEGDDLTVRGIMVDCAKGAGTMTGVAFADEGTFVVENAPDESVVTLPGRYDRRLAGWKLASSDRRIAKRELSIDANGVATLHKRGLFLLVR